MKDLKPYILASSNWKEVSQRPYEMAIIPWGATEAHNYHLPYGTDNYETESIARNSARIAWDRDARPVVLPLVPYGVNTGQRDIAFDMNIYPTTQLLILKDLAEVINRQGIRKLMIFNGHGGNDFRLLARELGASYPDLFICVLNWYQALEKSSYFENSGDHADEMETSLMLFLYPDMVADKKFWGEGKEKKIRIKAFREGWLWTERKWPMVTSDTGIGNPTRASSGKGEKYFNDLCNKIADVIVEICKTNPESLYE